MRLLVLAAAVASTLTFASQPTPAALRKTFENNRHAVVRVTGPKRSGAGVIVGASGHVLTSVEHVGLHEAQVEIDGAQHKARVLIADAYQGIALVQLEGTLRAAPVRDEKGLRRGDTLVAIRLSKNGAVPEIVTFRRAAADRPGEFELDRTVPKGSPVFDAKGKLVGVVVKGRRVVAVSVLKQRLAASAG